MRNKDFLKPTQRKIIGHTCQIVDKRAVKALTFGDRVFDVLQQIVGVAGIPVGNLSEKVF